MKFWQWFVLLSPIAVGLLFLWAKWMDKNVQEEPKCDKCGQYVSDCDCWK
jgi:hypothetical protein